MKRWLCALLVLALCLPAALADGDESAETPPAAPAVTEVSEPKPEPKPEPEPAPEPEPEPAPEPKPESKPVTPQEPEVPQNPEAPQEPETSEGTEGAEPAETAPAEGEGELPGDGVATLEGLGPLGAPLLGVPQEMANAVQEGYLDGKKSEPGALAELLKDAGEKTIYLLKDSVTIENFKLALLKDVTLLPDPEAFPGDYIVTRKNGDVEITDEDVENATADQTVTLVISVEKKPTTPAEPGPGPGGEGEIKLVVQAPDYTKGEWQNTAAFYLSGIPEGSEDYSYVALVYDSKFIPLSADVYVPEKEGEYTVSFAIWDAQGDVVSSSESYELMLDYTPPELSIEVSTTEDYTMTLSGSDELSGVVELSLDGGETWNSVALDEGLSVVHTEPRKRTFPVGMIQIRDAAGNVTGNEDEIVLDKIPAPEVMDFGGFGGGGEPKATAAPHASGDGDDAPYDAYELALPEGPVETLTLGGEAIDLGLAQDGGTGEFTAELTTWASPGFSMDDGTPASDTLILRAAGGETGTFAWRINGAVLRKLYNSDIAYLALAAGDAMLALPTVGFTAGTRYAELKMAGVSTAEFVYEIAMRVGPDANIDPGMSVDPETGHSAASAWNIAPNCAVTFAVEVEGEHFEMIDRTATPEMYPFDVYCGPADLTNYPYGEYPGLEAED